MLRRADTSAILCAALLTALSLAALVTVSCAGLGATCQFDSDCSGGNLCVQQTCYAACTAAADCETPYDICQPYTREDTNGGETVKICVTEDFDPANNDAGADCEGSGDCCTSDEECVEHFGDDNAVCGIDKRCIIPVSEPDHAVLIRDRSDVDASAEPEDGGLGSDVAAVFVRPAAGGEPLGYGVALDYAPVNDAGGPDSALDGSAPALGAAGQCVAASFEETALSLGGAGGYVLVGFEDADGQRLQLNNSMEVVVIEWGANCGASDEVDAFDVFFCSSQQAASSDAGGAQIDPGADCTQQLNAEPVSGYQTIAVQTDR